MTKIIKRMVVLTICLFFISIAFAQPNNRYQMYYIHEDPVKPSMTTGYENASANLISLSKKYNVNADWLTVWLDNNTYMYVSPIQSMADLDKNLFEPLEKNMSKDAYGKIWSDFDKHYDSHRDYIVRLDKDLTYMPAGIDIKTEGLPYRHFTYYYTTPQNVGKLDEIAKAFKELYTKKGSKVQYRIYRNGFGEPETYFMVVNSAKNPEEYDRMRAANMELLGDEGKQLYNKWLQYVTGIKHVTGMAKSELSYSGK